MRITPNYKGYHYLLLAYKLTRRNLNLLNAVTTKLFPMIANEYGTTPQSVERRIDTVLRICYDEGLLAEFKYKPTIAQFIGIVWHTGPSQFLLTDSMDKE